MILGKVVLLAQLKDAINSYFQKKCDRPAIAVKKLCYINVDALYQRSFSNYFLITNHDNKCTS